MDIPKSRIQQELVYKNTPQRNLMLTFLPPIEDVYEFAPIYFLITGGGWVEEKRQNIMECMTDSIEILRMNGFAVVSIDYRVCPEGVSVFDIITDCFDAVKYIAHYAEILRIDKNSFYLAGHSAGGHLVLMVSYATSKDFMSDYAFKDDFTVRAVAAISPPTILYDNGTHSLGDLKVLFQEEDTWEKREMASPISYVSSSCPPSLLCAGTSDWAVFSNSTERLYRKLRENHVESQLVLSVGGGHMFEKVHETVKPSISWDEIQQVVAEFILNHMNGIVYVGKDR